MKKTQKTLAFLWGLFLLVIGIVLFVFVLVVRQAQSQGDIQAYPPPPTRVLTPFPSDNTAEPVDTGCCATVYPTQTPIIASKTVDLSPELGESEEYSIYVQKNTGEIILYLIGPLQGDWRDGRLPDAYVEMLPLEPGDEIIWVERPLPPALQIPTEIPASPVTPTSTPTLNPAYPYPGYTPPSPTSLPTLTPPYP